MTTLTELADRVQASLDDTAGATWDQAEIEAWVTDAVRDYSITFPRTISDTKDTVLNDRTYGLFDDFLEIVSVEYPTAEDPPKYLDRMSYQQPGFWNAVGFYDLITRRDETEPGTLIISEKPAAGELITIEYLAIHTIPSSGSDTLTIPEEHEHILILFAIHQAWRFLTSQEMQSPTSSSSLLMGQMNDNARDALKDYQAAIKTAKGMESDGGRTEGWRMDKWDDR